MICYYTNMNEIKTILFCLVIFFAFCGLVLLWNTLKISEKTKTKRELFLDECNELMNNVNSRDDLDAKAKWRFYQDEKEKLMVKYNQDY